MDVIQGDANESEQSLIADDTSDTVREDQTFGQGELKDLNEYLKGTVGADHNAKKWLEGCERLDDLEKSEVVIRLVYEVCLAKNIEYDLENDAVENEKENNKDRNFDTRRIFEILKRVNRLLLPQDRRKLVEFVCKSGNVKLLEMICKRENKDGGGETKVDRQYSWKGEFTGYDRLIDLLQYVLKEKCSSEIVLCIAEKVYGTHHNVLSGREYLEDSTIQSMEKKISQPDSVVEDCLKAAIKLGYKDVVQVMLSGDIYHCIRLMKSEKFQEGKKALDMIEKTVAEVMSSWVRDERQSFKDDIQRLLKEGIEVDIKKMGKRDLIAGLEDRGIKLTDDDKKKETLEKLMKEEGGKVRLSKTVVGSLISTLFFNYQNELMEKTFKIGISEQDKGNRKKEIDKLKEKIDSKSFVKEKVLEKIKSLNKSSHQSNSWFFREVLEKIVNDEGRWDKLKAVCAAICKEKVEELLKGKKVHKGVADALEFFGIESNQIKTSTPKKGHSGVSVIPHFKGDIENLVKGIRELNDPSLMVCEVLEIAEGLASNKVPAFSGLSRRTIINLKSEKYGTKKSITKDRTKELEKAVNQILGEIKQGIDLLAKDVSGEYLIDIEDVFRHFEVINSEIKKEDKREIVELVCQTGNVKLLEMICKRENKDGGGEINIGRQYSWKGKFTGYDRLIDLLQYVLKEKCSSEIVLCIAKKVYGTCHNVLSGREYLEDSTIQSMEKKISQPDSVVEDCLKAAIKLGYKDVVQVMLSGDIYHCIRLMKSEEFQEGKKALDMIEKTVAEVMSSWVRDERQSFKDDIQRLLKEGIEINIEKMGKKDLIDELEFRGIEVKDKKNTSKKELMKMLKGEKVGKVRLSKTVVGSLISTLFFNYQMKKPFKIGISHPGESKRKKEIDELKEKIDSKSFVKEKVLEKIKLLNSSSHISNDWFFKEVLSAIVNDEKRFNKLKAVCAAICKEKVEGLLKDVEVGEEVMNVLEFFGVDPLVLYSPGSKAAEKKNKGFMQNNYRQGGESYYNAGTGSYLNMRNSSRGVKMDSKEKLLQFSLRGEDSDLIVPDLPEISCLMKNHDTGYEQRLLDKILDYNRIVNHPYLQEGSSEGASWTSGDSMNQSQQLDFSKLGDKGLAAIKAYKDGVGLLKLGREKDGKEEFKKAADKGFSHAGYVYAMMTFKEVAQHEIDNKSKLPKKGDINKAVQYMINVKKEFFPFSSFVLGMMKSNDKIKDKIFVNKKARVASARECFDDVLSGIGCSEGKYSLTLPSKYIVVEGESEEYLKWVFQSTKYELARSKLSCPGDLSEGKRLIQELSSGNFVDAKYLYALKLLRDNFGDPQNLEKENFGQAYTLLEEAINHGHKEAMFLFGTLPFREEFKLLDEESQGEKGSCCFRYLREYIETCGKDGEFTKDAAILIAAEHVKEKSLYVEYSEDRARSVLRDNDCLDELQELERKLQQRNNKVLYALEKVRSELKKNGEQSAQQLSSKVEELLDALQNSGLIIQQSERLSTTLKLLCIPSAAGEQYFLFSSLQHLCDVLKLQVDSQSHKEVLSPLQNLFSECIELQRERVLSQDLNLDKPSAKLKMGHGCSVSPILSDRQSSSPGASSTRREDDDRSISHSNESYTERERRGRREGNSGYCRS